MDDTTLTTPDANLADARGCTRCEGRQLLVGSDRGMGSYRCGTCTMTVGFDFEAEPIEFLIDRGTPALYTRDVFGDRLSVEERRLGS